MYFTLVDLLKPFTVLYLLMVGALVALWLRHRGGQRTLIVFTVLFGLFTLLCMPAVAHFALGSLEWQYAPLGQRPENTEALVVLAGGFIPADGQRPEPELTVDSYYRCQEAVRLYRQGPPCPVLVSGGKEAPDAPEPACAEVMRTFLLQLGVAPADILVEGRSQTTYDNARFSRELLQERHLQRVVLVTEATHMFRGERCFRKQGLDVVPAACNFRATTFDWALPTFVPSPGAARACQDAEHEWVGAIWYWLNGRM